MSVVNLTAVGAQGSAPMKQLPVASTLISAGLLSHPLAAVAGATEGKMVFDNQCSNCHTTVVGKNGFGPSLAELIGRSSGRLADYHYSTAMGNAGLTWNKTTLDEFLTSSTTKVPGTLVAVSIAGAKTRPDVIAYLETLGMAPAVSQTTQTASTTPLGRGPTGEELLGAATDREGWLYASKDYMGQRFAVSHQITAANAAQRGDLDDNFVAVDTKTGKTLYSFNTGGSVGGGVISYELKGKQYVAALSGAVSGFFGGSGPAALIVFALP